MNHIKKFILLSFVALVGLTSCSDDDPIVPDYTTYQFENYLTGQEVDLENSNGYSFTVTLNRSTATQEDDITLSLLDASGKFGFDNGQSTKIVTFGKNVSSIVIEVAPVDASMISIFETYDVTVSMSVPAGTPSQSGYSVDVTAMPLVNWEPQGDGNIDYGWAFATPIYGGTSKVIQVDKDSNVAYYNCNDVYAADYNILFAIDENGEVVIEDQRMFETDAAQLGAQYIMMMQVTSAVYDATAKTVTLTYDMANEDPSGVNLPASYRTGIVDVITLP